MDSLTQASLTLLRKIKKTSELLKWFKRGAGDRFIPQKKTIKAYLPAAADSGWHIWSITEEEVESDAARETPTGDVMFVSVHTVQQRRGETNCLMCVSGVEGQKHTVSVFTFKSPGGDRRR